MTQTLTHSASGAMLAERIRWARSPMARARGLIGSSLGASEALIIVRASQVHTFFMGEGIDVVFCDRGWRVLHVVSEMPPRRITRWVRGALYVVELPAGAAGGVRVNDLLELVESPVGT